ncbi:MAG: phosphoribosylformylglycinamidine synthase [Deltaproteobacteria bacterium]|nr:MAG: phosphoribosylformylglycinamidine synthase [Deltaproteobacteria bacterium]RUA02288.1 MAG: phosphoribosylformylglycinamidine synthase [Deltaproteobacteria bacterium]
MNKIKALVLTGYGLNCDIETAHACTLAGAEATRVHINALIDGSVRLGDFQLMVFIGGFSWGDDHGAGVIQSVRMKTHLGDEMQRFIRAGNLVLGICNGFQVLVNLGLLPALDGDYQQRRVALIHNDCGNFRDQWVQLRINSRSPCVFTRKMTRIELPVRHGEGKFYAESEVIAGLESGHQIVMQYAGKDGKPAHGRFPDNPNGSVRDIAGICDPTGRVFGLMPHPEADNHPASHPDWSRKRASDRHPGGHYHEKAAAPDSLSGIRMFQNAVDYFN